MKHHFPFYGIKSPQRKEVLSPYLRTAGKLPYEKSIHLVYSLWERRERECQYAALAIFEKQKKNLPITAKEDILYFVTHKSWWDTVDHLASHMSGAYFQHYPELLSSTLQQWITDENMWVRRTALLTQLKYKDKTNKDLLFSLIEECMDENEFFIKKAIGWALREYSKTDREAVESFVARQSLAKLSEREALKWLQNQRRKQK